MTEIPSVAFRKQARTEIGFETVMLSRVFERRSRYDHFLDRDHRVRFNMLLLITRGSGTQRIDFQSYPYRKGCVLLIAEDQVHAFDGRFQSDGIAVMFTERFLIKNAIRSDILAFHRLFNYHLNTPLIQAREQSDQDLAAIFGALHEEYNSTDDAARESILRAYLKILLLKAERIKKRSLMIPEGRTGWIDLFTRFKNLVIDEHTRSRNAKDYADRLGISYKHLNDICRFASGRTPKQFLDGYLILEINRKLSITDLSVKELTYHFNFDEPTNFVKFFKKHTEQTPHQFRHELHK